MHESQPLMTVEQTDGHHKRSLHIPFFLTEFGDTLHHVTLYYETWGILRRKRDNVVLICHALTGDARAGDTQDGPGWWSAYVGPGKAIDTNRYFVLCSNVLGGCSGSTGPASPGPDGQPYGLSFPEITVRDMVRAQQLLLQALGIEQVHAVIGGSLGGMQTWEWAAHDLPVHAEGLARESTPSLNASLSNAIRVRSALVIAAHAAFPPLAIGYNAAMRQAITADPAWHDGNYYDTGEAPEQGLALARKIGLLTYRAGDLYERRFSRRPLAAGQPHAPATGDKRLTGPRFEVESYLDYNGNKFVKRFDANSYLYLTRAMDSHDIGRSRGGLDAALANMRTPLTLVGIDSDYLYDARDLARTAQQLQQHGAPCTWRLLTSQHGHDAFLMEDQQLSGMISEHLERTWTHE